MPRFVILEHDHPFLHWDLMFEAGTVLRTWRLTRPLGSNPAPSEHDLHRTAEVTRIPAEELPDHRMHYLDYEGPVSRNRGSVKQVESGWFHLLSATADCWELRLEGNHASGFVSLNRIAVDSAEWVLAFMPDVDESPLGE
ncbi:DNA polymerase ligase N-terminal domain-containing protein [Rubinisphaera margarita]|uniref:DNA polymerase ligase N-terminal domain-containing protein n=1 Tax=Rubinisphaera margarita TaxID=2909586 RepID=UPI001EE947EB|nr:DNA polymerase ligase N-terminal domain-containing protein [Rubinisphaera margarita]MCG6155579.1 hypothetical protein [Rubinisphaera margarita]